MMAEQFKDEDSGLCFQYTIGNVYQYSNYGDPEGKKFKLNEVGEFGAFKFECGHWCMESIFFELYDCINKKWVSEDVQIKMYL